MMYNAVWDRKFIVSKDNDNDELKKYETLLDKIEELIRLGKDVQVVDRIWE